MTTQINPPSLQHTVIIRYVVTDDSAMASYFDSLPSVWCDEHCQDIWYWDFLWDTVVEPEGLVEICFSFANIDDAVMFKLVWG